MTDDLAQQLMLDFADSTGLTGEASSRRYLWTDAFAVRNFLALYRRFGENRYLELAVRLVDQVHHILGRHRDDDARSGWISGLSDKEGELHPTRGGLRIGKPLNERNPNEPLVSVLEWDRDGQYFHYLTQWMRTLHQMAQVTGEDRYEQWAIELAACAHDAFTYEVSPGGSKRMMWKMSIDLSRPLVTSMGQHDPLDGLVTYLELQTAGKVAEEYKADLTRAIAETTQMGERASWATDDPLGIGGLLDTATRLASLVFEHQVERHRLLQQLLVEADESLQAFARSPQLGYPAERRLAFRELGLTIGCHGLPYLKNLVEQDVELAALVDNLLKYLPIAEQIQVFWAEPVHRQSSTWREHSDINMVMLATCLLHSPRPS